MVRAVDGVLQRTVLCHQANGVIEIAIADLATLQRLAPEAAFDVVAAPEGEYHRQRDLALAKIVADVLAELGGLAAIVQHVVDQLKRDAEVHADRAERGLLA